MPIANKEFVLNYATNRWKLNQKRNVGSTSDSIRICNPSSLLEWADYYYSNIKTRDQINELGCILYSHIADDLPEEKRYHPELLDSISEDDCINFMHDLVINRTYEGFLRERGRL